MQERGHHIDNRRKKKKKRKKTESKSCKRKHFLVSEKGRTWIPISQGKATHAYIYVDIYTYIGEERQRKLEKVRPTNNNTNR